MKSRGNSLPFHVCACSSPLRPLSLCRPMHSARSLPTAFETRNGGRRRDWKGERREGKRRELDAHLVGGRVGATPPSVQNGPCLARQTLPPSGWTDSQSEEQGARTTGSRTFAWCDKVERNSNFASSSCRMRNAQLFLKVQRAGPSSSSTMPLFIHALKGGKLFWYGWRRFSGYTI